jgi:hypothetical protein
LRTFVFWFGHVQTILAAPAFLQRVRISQHVHHIACQVAIGEQGRTPVLDLRDDLISGRDKVLHVRGGLLSIGRRIISTRVDALGAGVEPAADFAKGERIALLVITPACDLQHSYASRFLFIAGIARPSELLLHKKPKELVTPILIHDEEEFVVEWDLGTPISWTRAELANHLKSGSFEKVRRFRSMFSLQLQQLFTSSLSRVGTPVMPPMQHSAGTKISYKDKDENYSS